MLLADGDRLYLQVSPSGTKSWIFRYTLRTQPLQRTKSAVLSALKRMGIEVTEREGGRIVGTTKEHNVEVQLTTVTEKTTRVTVNMADGDKATGEEIVEQTKRALNTATKGS